MRFKLSEPGICNYEIRTNTTFLRRVNGELKEVQRKGYGSGTMDVRGPVVFDLVMGNVVQDGYFEVKLAPQQAVKQVNSR